MRRRSWAALAALAVVAALVPAAASATPQDECQAKYASNTIKSLQAYVDCRFDRLDKGLKPGPTVTVTVTATPSASATPSESASETPSATPTTPAGGIIRLGRSFPDATTTGVPAGVTLTPYTGPCTITAADTVIDGKTVNCELRIAAKGVAIRNSKINGSVSNQGGSFTIVDSAVALGDVEGTGIGEVDFTASRVEVTGGNRSINCFRDCTVEASYVHGQYLDVTGEAHESGIRMGSGSAIRGNTIACDAKTSPHGCSAALTGYGDFAVVENNIIDGNLIRAGSGGYCAYGGSTKDKPFSDGVNSIRFTNNVWERGTEKSDHGTYICGYYGPIVSFDSGAPGNVWTNNLFDDGSPVVP